MKNLIIDLPKTVDEQVLDIAIEKLREIDNSIICGKATDANGNIMLAIMIQEYVSDSDLFKLGMFLGRVLSTEFITLNKKLK